MDREAAKQVSLSIQGIGVSPGIAVGAALLYRTPAAEEASPLQTPVDLTAERERLQAAIAAGIAELHALAERIAREIGRSEGEIFTAQALMLEDPTIAERAEELLAQGNADAATALSLAAEEQAAALAQLPDPVWQGRAADVRDAARAALAHLRPSAQVTLAQLLDTAVEPVVVVAEDLAPSETTRMAPAKVCAIALAQGSATSHAAILARALRIPAVVGLGPRLLEAVHEGAPLVVNGGRGTLTLSADEASLQAARMQADQYRQTLAASQTRQAALRDQPGSIRDGHRVPLLANVGSADEARAAAEVGAEGIGLLRTEFLFAQSTTLPDERQQADLYAEIILALAAARGPIIIRTLDAGSDKPLPALGASSAAEVNPALGVRGIRLQAGVPDLLATQLRGILLAARRTQANVQVMLPMVSTVEEVRAAKSTLQQARESLAEAGMPSPPLGIMVETPAAVLSLEALAQEAAFFSIGTNDLTQYVMAADRLNPQLVVLNDPAQPAVLRALAAVVRAARAAHRHVSVCGEMAGDPLLALLLVGLGVESLSMTPASIPGVKEALAAHTLAELQALAERATKLATVHEVRELLGELAR
ncbi:MAG TPA: phosphoenolpyruvate--protein phosphotransferase [Ktedonobacterales bacterium]|jgi:phosphoenolpyruvate-protein phosphotransferase|nr:phosphoenolpyruvate--protein phosphotransferase [Ktedonobacterales bacterium]